MRHFVTHSYTLNIVYTKDIVMIVQKLSHTFWYSKSTHPSPTHARISLTHIHNPHPSPMWHREKIKEEKKRKKKKEKRRKKWGKLTQVWLKANDQSDYWSWCTISCHGKLQMVMSFLLLCRNWDERIKALTSPWFMNRASLKASFHT